MLRGLPDGLVVAHEELVPNGDAAIPGPWKFGGARVWGPERVMGWREHR